MTYRVIGSGMAGLLAGCMLRDECLGIFERQEKIPNNHSALLRFRSSVVGDTLNIPFKKVRVLKEVIGEGSRIAQAVTYSVKTNGTARIRSVINTEDCDRYIAPPDLIDRMMSKVQAPIHFDHDETFSRPDPVISTIPMPALAAALDYRDLPSFHYAHGWTIKARLQNTDLYVTQYIADGSDKAYRVSITGNELIIEFAFPGQSEEMAAKNMEWLTMYPKELQTYIFRCLNRLGLGASTLAHGVKPEVKPQRYAKILPIDDDKRKRFIMWATEKHNIYSFGRFATWKPGLLLDDLVGDLRTIQRIREKGTYDHRK